MLSNKIFSKTFLVLFFFSAFLNAQKKDTTKLSFDLGITRGGNVNLWPLFKRYKSADKKQLQILYPVFSKQKNYKEGFKHYQFLPFYISDSSAAGKDKRIGTFFYPSLLRFHKPNPGDTSSANAKSFKFFEIAPYISLLEIKRSPNGMLVNNNFFFFVWYKKDAARQKSHFVTFPLYWRFTSKTDTTQFFLPLAFSKKSKGRQTTNIALLYHHHKDSTKNSTTFFPLVWKKDEYVKGDTIRKRTFFPLFHSKKSRTENNKIFFPIVYSLKNEKRKVFTVFPFYSRGKYADSSSYYAITPLFWHFETKEGKRNVFFPFWWNKKKFIGNDTIRENVFLPFVFTKKSKKENNKVILPFVYSFKNEKRSRLTIFPFFSKGKTADSSQRYTAITPFFWHTHKKNVDKNIFFPLVWNKKEITASDTIRTTRVLPLYWSVKDKYHNDKVLFPLVFSLKNKRRTHFSVFPLFAWNKRKDSTGWYAFTPFLWHSKNHSGKRNVFFPLFWNHTDYKFGDTIKSTKILPFVFVKRSKDENNTVFAPLFFHLKNKERNSLTLFPLFTHTKRKDSTSYTGITPLFWHINRKDGKRSYFFPLFWDKTDYYKNDTIRRSVFFPLYWSKKSDSVNKKTILPFVFSIHDRKKDQFTIFPLYSHGKRKDKKKEHLMITPLFWKTRDTNTVKTVFFPFYYNKKTFTTKDTIRKTVIFPFYYAERSSHGKNKTFIPLVYGTNDKHGKSFTLFPLFSFGFNRDSSSHYFAITPFIWHAKDKHHQNNFVFPLFWNKKTYLKDDTIKRTVFIPFYWRKHSKKENKQIYFPLVYSFKSEKKQRFTFLPFFSYGRKADSSSYFAITPLFWHKENKRGERNILFPLYWNKTNYTKDDTIRSTRILPFYFSYHSRKKDNKVVLPFVYKLKNEKREMFTVFPFYSKGQGADSSKHLMIGSLFWHFEKKKSERSIFFPLVWTSKHISDSDIVTRVNVLPFYFGKHSRHEVRHGVFPLVWMKTRYTTNDTIKSVNVLPFFYSKHSRQEDKTTVFPFVFHHKTATKNVLTVFPFYAKGEFADGRKYKMISPFFWHREGKWGSSDVLLPFYFRKTNYYANDTVQKLTVFPFWYSKDSKTKHNRIFFPFLFKLKNTEREHLTIFPFFSKGHSLDGKRSYYAISPFFWHKQNEKEKTNVLFPFFWNRQKFLKNDTVKTVTLLPLYWSRKSKSENSKVIFPFVYRYHNKEKNSLTVLPFFSWSRNADSTKSHLVITPLFWHTKNRGVTRNVFFPLYWKKKTQYTGLTLVEERILPLFWKSTEYRLDDTIRKTSFIPFYFSKRSRKENNKVLFPLVYSFKNDKRKVFTFLPLFSFGRSADSSHAHLVLSPLFWHTKNGNIKRNVLFPFYWQKREMTKHGEIKSVHVLPLFHRTKTPLANDTVVRTAFLPFYWSLKSKKENNKIIFPLVYKFKDEKRSQFTFAPLYSQGGTSDKRMSHLMVTPLFWKTKKDSVQRTVLFPFYWKKKVISTKDTFERSAFLPFCTVRKEGNEKNVSVLWFLYKSTKKEDYKKVSVLWPICEREKAKTHRSFRFAPFIWTAKNDTSRLFAIEPFFYNFKSDKRKTFILSAWLYKREVIKDTSTMNSILWRTWYGKKWKNGDFEKRLFHVVYANVKKKGKREFSLQPFYSREKDTIGNRSVSVFFSFYSRFREYRADIKDFYEEERIFWFLRLRSNYKKLKAQGKVFKRR